MNNTSLFVVYSPLQDIGDLDYLLPMELMAASLNEYLVDACNLLTRVCL
jgi:hypothetical protein